MPVLPISSIAELRPTLESFRREASITQPERWSPLTLKTTVSRYVRGIALSESQTNVLTGIASNVDDLIAKASTEDGQRLIIEYLGEKDGQRVVSFLSQNILIA
jgi:hypothetical protein